MTQVTPPSAKPRLFSDSPSFPMQYQNLRLMDPLTLNNRTTPTYPFIQNSNYYNNSNCGNCVNINNLYLCYNNIVNNPSTNVNNNNTNNRGSFSYSSFMNTVKGNFEKERFNNKKKRKSQNYRIGGLKEKKRLSNFSGKKNSKLEHYDIDEFKAYLSSLPCAPYEYLCSQKGAKDVQKILMKLSSECKTMLITVLNSSLSIVMTDIYGNYFIQEFVKFCNDNQLILILNYISANYVTIAKDYSGTHVLQALLDKSNNNLIQEQIVLNAIRDKEIEMAYDNNATHVLQKIVTTISEERREKLNEVILSNLQNLCFNSNGNCLVKKMIKETKSIDNMTKITNIITEYCIEIAQDPYGNYVIQYLFEEWDKNCIAPIIDILIENISSLSIQKFSSNVSEKLIELVDDDKKVIIFNKLFAERELLSVLKNKYGRFVLQKAVKIMQKEKKEEIKNSLSQLNLSSQKESNHLKSFLACF